MGSAGAFSLSQQETINTDFNTWILNCKDMYNTLLLYGVAAEQARMVLPMCMDTKWIWTASLAAWARLCGLRLDEHVQPETKVVAVQIAAIMEELFPVAWPTLLEYQ